MHFFSHVFFFLMVMVASANAHIKMRFPPPVGDINNAPLNNARNPGATTGGEFPCKVSDSAAFAKATVTNLQLGTELDVLFQGSAVHGGGSCQFSLTKDPTPNSNSVFKVIHSVEGGCPARNQDGNLTPADPNLNTPGSYPVPIPPNLTPGRYTFAWSWVNKAGNREYYMNCAVVQIGSGAGNSSTEVAAAKRDIPHEERNLFARTSDPVFDDLPDMVVLNTNSDNCTYPEGVGAFRYANPGKSVERNEDMSQVKILFPQCLPGGKQIFKAAADASSPASSAASSAPTVAPTGGATTVNAATLTFASGPATSPSTFSTVKSTPSAGVDSSIGNTNLGKGIDDSNVNITSVATDSTCPDELVCKSLGFQCVTVSEFIQCGNIGDCAVKKPMADGTLCQDGTVVADTQTPSIGVKIKFRRSRYVGDHLHRHVHGRRGLLKY